MYCTVPVIVRILVSLLFLSVLGIHQTLSYVLSAYDIVLQLF